MNRTLTSRIAGMGLITLGFLLFGLVIPAEGQIILVSASPGITRIARSSLSQNVTSIWNVTLPSNATSLGVQIENTGGGGLTYNISFANPSLDTVTNTTGLSLVCSRVPNNAGLGSNNLAALFTAAGAGSGTSDYYSCPWPTSQHLLLTITPTSASPSASVYVIANSGTQSINPTASAGSLTAGFANGASISEKGPRWSVLSTPAVSVQASASKAAGASGTRHVADCVNYTAGAIAAPTATQLTLNLRDGATGAGTIIWSKTLTIPATAAPHYDFSVCGLNLIGSSATAMTLEFSALLTSEFESVTLTGYDVN